MSRRAFVVTEQAREYIVKTIEDRSFRVDYIVKATSPEAARMAVERGDVDCYVSEDAQMVSIDDQEIIRVEVNI